MRSLFTEIDLTAWDNWLPLGVIAAFLVLGALVGSGLVSFGVAPGDVERFHFVYTELGIQTTAGIFAIIISLSLMAIQFAAQEYSHRIMEYYVKSVIFWSTLIVFLGVIMTGIVLQARSSDSDSLKGAEILLVGSMLTLALLVPHFLVTASYLKPEFIIGKLLRRVDDAYLRWVRGRLSAPGGEVVASSDRLLPVVEITERSIDRGDLSTTRGSLERVRDLYLVQSAESRSPEIDRYFLSHILRIGRKAVSQDDEQEASVIVIDTLGRLGTAGPAGLAAENIDILGFAALRRDAEVVVAQMMGSLRLLFDGAPGDVRARILDSYGELVGRLASGGRERLLRQLATYVADIGGGAQQRGDSPVEERCLDLLEAVGHDAAASGMMAVVLQTGLALKDLGVAAAAGNFESAERTVLRLLRIERAVSNTEREAIASLGFAKGEIERALRLVTSRGAVSAEQRQPDGPPTGEARADVDAEEIGAGELDVLDLWSKPEQ